MPLECLGLNSFYFQLQTVAMARGIIHFILATTFAVGMLRAVRVAEAQSASRAPR